MIAIFLNALFYLNKLINKQTNMKSYEEEKHTIFF